MTTITIRRGDAAEIPITNLVDEEGSPATFNADDVLTWTAKKHLASPDTLFVKSSTDGGMTYEIGGDSGEIVFTAADWSSFPLRSDLAYVWDIEYREHGGEPKTIASGDGIIKVDVGGNPIVDPTTDFLQAMSACSPWATSGDVVARFNYDGDSVLLDQAMAMSTDILYELTGQRWPGRCHDAIRPTAQWRKIDQSGWLASISGNGSRGDWGYCSCHLIRRTGCSEVPEIKLPGNPVDPSTIVVTIDGVTFIDWQLSDHRYLQRTDGRGWPCCQNRFLPLDQVGTWGVAYDHGSFPPPGGKISAMYYGYQIALSMDEDDANNKKCKLPKRVTAITRQGMTVAVLDPNTLVKDGLTGLAMVDQWVSSVNLGAARRRSTVLNPGNYRSARRINS